VVCRRAVVLPWSSGAKTDVADVTRDGIRLIVAFVNDFHILCVTAAAGQGRAEVPAKAPAAAAAASRFVVAILL